MWPNWKRFNRPVEILGTVLWLVAHADADCTPYPVAAPIRNVTLSNGQISRGIALSIGTPEQHLAFTPRWPTNNVIIHNSDNGYCRNPSFTETACTTWRGGLYDLSSSDSAGVADPSSIAEELDDVNNIASGYIAERFVLSANTSISGMPFGKAFRNGDAYEYSPRNMLGMGDNSTVLRILKDTGRIVSRTWSLYAGWNGAATNHQRDGVFVFGGYDQAKVSGRGYKFPMGGFGTGCRSRLRISISDMVLNLSNGTNISLFEDDTKPFNTCIWPQVPLLMTLNNDPFFKMMDKFIKTSQPSQHGLLPDTSPLSSKAPPYTGDLTITIDGGPSIRIPNHQLIQPDQSVTEPDGELIRNGTVELLTIKRIPDGSNNYPTLGNIFLSAAYLMGNLDANEFTIWEANPSDDENLVAVDEIGQEVKEFCTEEQTSSAPETTPPPNSQNSEKDSSGLSTGAIAGIAVGSVAGIAALAVGLFLIWRRQRKTASYDTTSDQGSDKELNQGFHTSISGQQSELHGSSVKPELHTTEFRPELQDTRVTPELA